MITVELVNWDYTSGVNKPTVVGHQHQVGNLESKFWYKQAVSNRFETKVQTSAIEVCSGIIILRRQLDEAF